MNIFFSSPWHYYSSKSFAVTDTSFHFYRLPTLSCRFSVPNFFKFRFIRLSIASLDSFQLGFHLTASFRFTESTLLITRHWTAITIGFFVLPQNVLSLGLPSSLGFRCLFFNAGVIKYSQTKNTFLYIVISVKNIFYVSFSRHT